MKGYSVLTIPTINFLFCVYLDWLILSVLRVPPSTRWANWHWHSLLLLIFKACSLLLLYCSVNSKWLTMIKQKMNLEWHYLKTYLKLWQVSVCSNISVLNTSRIRNCGFFVARFLLLWNQRGKYPYVLDH